MKKILGGGAALALLTLAPLAALPAPASAVTRANVSISIEGDDPSGTVTSRRAVCRSGVTVRLVKQVGAKGGGDDRPTGLSDTTDAGGDYDFGNPGLSDGKYYAKVRGTTRCKAATSPTLVVSRD